MSTILVLSIPAGKHYMTFDTLQEAVVVIKKKLEQFLFIVPQIDLNGITTGGELAKITAEAVAMDASVSKEDFIKLLDIKKVERYTTNQKVKK